MKSTIAVISFPGMNCEVESLRAVRRSGMDAFEFRWNDNREKLRDVDGYFLPGGFSYEDRGRAGMIAAHDPLMDFLREESEGGKVIIGHCNGAQVLVESGLIPLDKGLRMALARNQIPDSTRLGEGRSRSRRFQVPSFRNEWVWIRRSCQRNRCATSDWEGTTCGEQCLPGVASRRDSAAPRRMAKAGRTMHVPIAHGEGRFTTKDPDLISELRKNDQIAFQYCDREGEVSEASNPNGSIESIAGICNPAGNVVALMPHPERTVNGDPYFLSMKRWVENRGLENSKRGTPPIGRGLRGGGQNYHFMEPTILPPLLCPPPSGEVLLKEIFIDTIITNNEERSLERLLKRYVPNIRLKQLRYIKGDPDKILKSFSHFNPNKEVAYIRHGGEQLDILNGVCLLRWDDGATEGIFYVCKNVKEEELDKEEIRNIFANPHASTMTRINVSP